MSIVNRWTMAAPKTKTFPLPIILSCQMAKWFETGFKFYPLEFKIWPQLQIWPEPWPSSTLASYITLPAECVLSWPDPQQMALFLKPYRPKEVKNKTEYWKKFIVRWTCESSQTSSYFSDVLVVFAKTSFTIAFGHILYLNKP